jgi:hypothetical protein
VKVNPQKRFFKLQNAVDKRSAKCRIKRVTGEKKMKRTAGDLEKWAKDNRSLAYAACAAKAFADSERERVSAYVKPLFAAFSFTDDLTGSGEKLTDPNRAYLSEDDEKAARFYAACDKAHREHGFTGPEGFCPALVAENLQMKAEDALLKSLCEFAGMSWPYNLKLRAKALGLALSACVEQGNNR